MRGDVGCRIRRGLRSYRRRSHRPSRPAKLCARIDRGRKKGTANKFTTDIREALIEAVNRFGRDGKGVDGMVGYLLRNCEKKPAAI
jgi:hypothetical protein